MKPFMGLTSFSGELPALKDIGIAKNYLQENELKILNNLVSGYFDLAEINAIEHKPMYMYDYVKRLDMVLSLGNRKLLEGVGTVSHKQALEKASALNIENIRRLHYLRWNRLIWKVLKKLRRN